jgi:hypothetical protein
MDSTSDAESGSTVLAPPVKRVQPQRLRRGGSAIGNNEIDEMILDTQRRRGANIARLLQRFQPSYIALLSLAENAPLIPANTKFILTTSLTVVPDTQTSTSKLNTNGNESYFERPEVLEAYREQQLIQTPEFVNIDPSSTSASLSRLRPLEDVRIMLL